MVSSSRFRLGNQPVDSVMRLSTEVKPVSKNGFSFHITTLRDPVLACERPLDSPGRDGA